MWVLPDLKPTVESLRWLVHELGDVGTSGVIARVDWLAGVTHAELTRQFRVAATSQWASFIGEARKAKPEHTVRMARRFDEIAGRDFFSVPARAEALSPLKRLQNPPSTNPTRKQECYEGRNWVTRKDIHLDRMASA